MANIMIKRKLIFIALLIAIISFCLFCVCIFQLADADYYFEEYYTLNESVVIPSKTININGVEYDSVAVITLPDGTAVSQNKIKASLPGKYSVEYRVQVNGKNYKETYNFTVKYPTFSTSSRNDKIAYESVTVNNHTVEGLNVRLTSGSRLDCNEVIDLHSIEKGENLISLFIVPETYGALDCRRFYLKVSDAFDENNYFTVQMTASPHSKDIVYSGAKACNQSTFYGVEKGYVVADTIYHTGNYGFASYGSFYGVGFGNNNYRLNISYDNDSQTILMDNNCYPDGEHYVIDFNETKCFSEGWDGFESGLVKVLLYGGDFAKNSVGFVITELKGVNLSEQYIPEGGSSSITVDYVDYDENSYPTAVLGKPYKIFPASTSSLYTREKLTVKVFTSYNSDTAAQVEIEDGCFVPKLLARHTIEYKCADAFGNIVVKTVNVNVAASADEIDFNLDLSPIKVAIGTDVTLPLADNFSGGNGKIELKTEFVDEKGNVQLISGCSFRAEKVGDCLIRYTATDYNSMTKIKEIGLKIEKADGPIFNEKPNCPETFIKGGRYALPQLSADDYSDGTLCKVTASVRVLADGEDELACENGYFIADAEKYISFIFSASDKLGSFTSKTFSVSVTDVGLKNDIDIAKYFKCENGTAYANDNCLVLSAIGRNNAKFGFIKDIVGKNFLTEFFISEGKNNFETFSVIISDDADKNATLKVSFINVGGNVFLSVNGGKRIATSYKFGGGIKIISISLNDESLLVCDEIIPVRKLSDGSEFSGFGNKIMLSYVFEGVWGEAAVELKKINNQILKKFNKDLMAPNIVFYGEFGGERPINSIARICTACASDVLNPCSVASYTVTTPSKEVAYDVDGNLLKDIPADRESFVLLDSYGSYKVLYRYGDDKENNETAAYVLTCKDRMAPVVEVDQKTIKCKVNDELKVPSIKVSDNISEEKNISVIIQILSPSQKYCTYYDGFVLSEKGKYLINILVFDKANNYVCKTIDVIVE